MPYRQYAKLTLYHTYKHFAILQTCVIQMTFVLNYRHVCLQVLFEATVGDGYLGDIAIDDVTFLQEDCQGQPGSMLSRKVLSGR